MHEISLHIRVSFTQCALLHFYVFSFFFLGLNHGIWCCASTSLEIDLWSLDVFWVWVCVCVRNLLVHDRERCKFCAVNITTHLNIYFRSILLCSMAFSHRKFRFGREKKKPTAHSIKWNLLRFRKLKLHSMDVSMKSFRRLMFRKHGSFSNGTLSHRIDSHQRLFSIIIFFPILRCAISVTFKRYFEKCFESTKKKKKISIFILISIRLSRSQNQNGNWFRC